MKTAFLCLAFLVAGAAGGWLVAGYLANKVHQRQVAMLYAGEVGLQAMIAEQMKNGDADIALGSIERSLPNQVLMLRENEMFKETVVTDSALQAVKRFYVCTKTEIPANIAAIMDEVPLAEDACPVAE